MGNRKNTKTKKVSIKAIDVDRAPKRKKRNDCSVSKNGARASKENRKSNGSNSSILDSTTGTDNAEKEPKKKKARVSKTTRLSKGSNSSYVDSPAGTHPEEDIESSEQDSSEEEMDNSGLEIEMPNLSIESEPNGGNGKKKPNRENWSVLKSFQHLEEAENFIESLQSWAFLNVKNTKMATKRYFRCKLVKRAAKCPAKIYLSCLSTNGPFKYVVFENNVDHVHPEGTASFGKMSEEARRVIQDMVRNGSTLMAIRTKLAENQNITFPSDNQITVAIREEKQNIQEGFNVSLGAIKKFIDENSKIPYDDDETFVLCSAVSELGQEHSFKYLLTTKTLLANATLLTKHLAADATYKLVYQDCPLVLVGSSDKFNKYHPFGAALVTSERTEDYQFVFDGLKTGIQKVLQVDYEPGCLVADGAKAIRNGFSSTYGENKPLRVCFVHVLKNIKDRIKQEKISDDDQDSLIIDITTIHQITDKDLFPLAVNLFKDKWAKKQAGFISYFMKQHVEEMPGWYVGFHPETPSTNNGNEGKNLSIKKHHTKFVKLGLLEANECFKNMIHQWSVSYRSNNIETSTGKITNDIKKKAYAFADTKKFSSKVIFKHGQCNFYAGDKNWKQKIKSFDDFKKQHNNIHVVATGTINTFSWKKCECSCVSFHKNYICIHVMALGYIYKQIEPDARALDAVGIGKKPKRGRKPKVKRAWIKD